MLPSDNFVKSHPIELNHIIRHKKQNYNWDCGLACLRMVLPQKVASFFDKNFKNICQAEGFKKSTWTIDLCYLLHKFQVTHCFRTKTLGVHSEYKQSEFYAPVIATDEDRVNQRFQQAICLGLDIREAELSMESILNRLQHGPAIVLTDSRLLTCSICKRGKSILKGSSYSGHYVVLTGYNLREKIVYYRNPAYFDHQCGMPMNKFDQARKAFGTDEDIIFINNDKNCS